MIFCIWCWDDIKLSKEECNRNWVGSTSESSDADSQDELFEEFNIWEDDCMNVIEISDEDFLWMDSEEDDAREVSVYEHEHYRDNV